MHGIGRCGQVLKVDEAKCCSSQSSIFALLAGVHSKGSIPGRFGTTVRGGQEHGPSAFSGGAEQPALSIHCPMMGMVGVAFDGG